MYQLAALIEAVSRIYPADAPSRCINDLPFDLPIRNLLVVERTYYRYMYLHHG